MYRAPLNVNTNNTTTDFEQIFQAYEQGYESRRQGKSYVNPWKRTPDQLNVDGYTVRGQLSWEDDLNAWFYNGYYDWAPGDWVPYLSDEQQSDYAINPKTNKSRVKCDLKVGIPKAAWNWPVATNLTAIIGEPLMAA